MQGFVDVLQLLFVGLVQLLRFSYSSLAVFFLQFLAERVEVARYSSDDQVSILSSLLSKSLSISVGRRPPPISRHPEAIGPRLRSDLAVLLKIYSTK